MSFSQTYFGRFFVTHFRVWTLVLAALVFGQLTAASHAHDAHDESRLPVACDVCLSAASKDESQQAATEPAPSDLPLPLIPESLRPLDVESAPSLNFASHDRIAFGALRCQPQETRAPPL